MRRALSRRGSTAAQPWSAQSVARLGMCAQVLSACFASGAVGGLCYQLAAVLVSALEIPQMDVVKVQGTLDELCLHVTLGGAFGCLFMFKPGAVRRFWMQATVYGMVPALARLLHSYHFTRHHIDAVTPLYVVLLDIIAWAAPGLAWFGLLARSDASVHDLTVGSAEVHTPAARLQRPAPAAPSYTLNINPMLV